MQYGDRVTREQLSLELTRAGSEYEHHGKVDILHMQASDHARFNWYMDLRNALMILAPSFQVSTPLRHLEMR
jgi:hypothetical protein